MTPQPGLVEDAALSQAASLPESTAPAETDDLGVRAHDVRLLVAACAAWACTAASAVLHLGYVTLALAGVVIAVVALALGWGSTRGIGRVIALVLGVTGLVCLTSAGHAQHDEQGPVLQLAGQHATVRADALVTSDPRLLPDTGRGLQYLVALRLRHVEGRGLAADVDTPVVVIGDERWKDVAWRSRLRIDGRLSPSTRLGASRAVLSARGGPQVLAPPGALVSRIADLRTRMAEATSGLPRDPAGLVPALVIGDTRAVPQSLDDDMNVTGMSHLNAVSGSNVTIVLMASLWCAAWMRCGRRGRLLVGLAVVALYVLICRPEPSVIRAAVMGCVGLTGTTLGRPRAACAALAAAIVSLLVYDPWLSVSAGFALSALATLGLVLFAHGWSQRVAAHLPTWCAKPVELCMIPIAAQALCLPVLVMLSGSISWISVPANVLAEPFVAPATLIGMLVLMVAPLSGAVASWISWGAGLPAWAIADIAHLAARVPYNAVPWFPGVWGVLAALLVVGGLMFAWRAAVWSGWRGAVAAGVVLLIPLAWRWPVPGEGEIRGAWVYAQCDVGQGDAELVRTGPHSAVAFDVGPPEGDVVPCAHRHRVQRLDAIVLTHFHADHVGGLQAMLEAYPGTPVYTTWVHEGAGDDEERRSVGHSSSRAALTKMSKQTAKKSAGEKGAGPSVEKALRAAHITPVELHPGERLDWPGGHADVLWPRRVIHDGSVQNNASLILDVEVDAAHVLVLGDAEREAQAAVVSEVQQRAARRPYDIVKVAHHGSANQEPRLYAAAAAPHAVIGVGKDNDYGHPSRKALALLDAPGTDVERTDTQGDVTFMASGDSVVPVPRR